MLIKADTSCLLVIDVQEKLVPAMADADGVISNAMVLMQAATRLAVPMLVSEQYPVGLGLTVEPLAERMDGEAVEKMSFSCVADDGWKTRFDAMGRGQAVIVGIEAHVCVLQTAMDLLATGHQVFVVADATSSRSPDSHAMALHRLGQAGAEIVTTEMVMFEWLGRAGTPEFKELSSLIK